MDKSIGIIFENYKELKELLIITRAMGKYFNISLQIVSPSKVYEDKASGNMLKELNKNENVYYIVPPSKKFTTLSSYEKIIYSLKVKKEIKNLFNDVDIVLSGVQTIFSRIMYKSLKMKKIPFFVYHRHLLFTTPFNSKRALPSNSIFKSLVKFLNIDEFFLEIPNVGCADKYLVLGEVNKDYLVENGVDTNSVYTTGSLEYDSLIDKDDLKKYFNKLDKFSIVYVSSAFEWVKEDKKEEEQKTRILELISLVKDSVNISLTIKVHPRENLAKYKAMKEKFPFIHIEYPSNKSIIESLCRYDLIIGWLSTAIFEISLLDKKILFYLDKKDLSGYSAILKYISSNTIITSIPDNIINKGNSIDVSNIIYFDKNERAINRITNIIKKELNVK